MTRRTCGNLRLQFRAAVLQRIDRIEGCQPALRPLVIFSDPRRQTKSDLQAVVRQWFLVGSQGANSPPRAWRPDAAGRGPAESHSPNPRFRGNRGATE